MQVSEILGPSPIFAQSDWRAAVESSLCVTFARQVFVPSRCWRCMLGKTAIDITLCYK
jgi:hypothetical protein